LDARGRALDNVFVERFWRSVKYEEVYLHDSAGMADARQELGRDFGYYAAVFRQSASGVFLRQMALRSLVRSWRAISWLNRGDRI
jgi:transposase InsO family protein